ncbi:AMP-binding protein [Alcaligenaceae bacterium]|nr:AMP-binding protein [Alcaligenaceae bacterium]
MNLAHLLMRSANVYPERPAVLHGSSCLHTYAELAERAARIASALREKHGLMPGQRVALFMKNVPQYIELLYGAWWAGLAVVPINSKLHPDEAAYIASDSEASLLFISEDANAVSKSAAPATSLQAIVSINTSAYESMLECPPCDMQSLNGDELAWLFYTSGTTGRPKGVMQSHRNLLAMMSAYFIDVDEITPDDAAVYAAPMSHGAGIYNIIFTAKAARHVIPLSGGFDTAELVGLAADIGRLCLFAAPTMLIRLVEHIAATHADCGGFKTIVYGGGPMYAEDIRRALQVMGPRFVQIYGQGEAPMTITVLPRSVLADSGHPEWPQRIASVGIPFALTEIRIADEHGNSCPHGEIGEVLVKGDVVMSGYWGNPHASAQALHDGWLRTGDMGYTDEHGFLTLRDRSKDLIISGGTNIYPREVEEVLLTHPGIKEVAVVGQHDAEWGEIVVAFVVAAPGIHAADLEETCLSRMARFKRPRHYHFVESLPKNNYGKVLKAALRERLAKDAALS